MDRNWLNEKLLTEAEKQENVRLVFQHKLVKCDVTKGVMTFLHMGNEKNIIADLIIGADGLHSQVRAGLMKTVPYTRSYKSELISGWTLSNVT